MIHIDKELCISCGKCVWDCFPGALTMENHTPILSAPASCLSCGHCIAICPVGAVSDDALSAAPMPVAKERDPEALLRSMESRRSCRHYKAEPVSEADLQMLLDAARACPTARNLQWTRYIAVTDSIPQLLNVALKTLGQVGDNLKKTETAPDQLRMAERFIQWAKLREKDKSFDPLFFHAPLVLMFVAPGDPRDAAAAAANAELMAWHLGLGCLYSGYFTACAAASEKIRAMLSLKDGESVVRCLVLGHPDVKFHRTAPRKPANITRL